MARPATSSVGRGRTRSARAPTDAGDATAQPRGVTRTVALRVLWPGRETASRNVARAPPERTTCRPAALDRASPSPAARPGATLCFSGLEVLPATDARDVSVQRTGRSAPGPCAETRHAAPCAARTPARRRCALTNRTARVPSAVRACCTGVASSGRQLAMKRARAAGGIGPKIAIPLPTRIGKSTSCDHPAPSVTVTLTTSPEVS